MLLIRHFLRTGACLAVLVFAMPAAAGTLAPRLRALANSYQTVTVPMAAARALSVDQRSPSPPFAPHVNAAGFVQVYLRYRAGFSPTRKMLVQLGANNILVSRQLGVIQAWVPIADLDKFAALSGVRVVTVPDYARVRGFQTRSTGGSCSSVATGLDIDGDAITAEHVDKLHAKGITGKGVKVGVISNGTDCRSESQAAGYLPASIHIAQNSDSPPKPLTGSGAEGTAMLEEVHAIAPDADLGFCGPGTTVEFLQCLTDFAQWGASVVTDDLFFAYVGFDTDVFLNTKTGKSAITEFADAHPNIVLVTAGGNGAQGYYEADYQASNSPSSPDLGSISLSPVYTPHDSTYGTSGRHYVSAMDFGQAIGKASDAAIKVLIGAGNSIYANLVWDDPAGGPYDDLDLFLLKQDGTVACSSTASQWCVSARNQLTHGNDIGSAERLAYTNNTGSNQTLYLVAYCYDCSAHGTHPLHIKLYGFMNGGGLFNYTTPGGVSGHSALEAETTAAAAWLDPDTHKITMEHYSDVGPFIYGDWANGTKQRQKPDITAMDGVLVSGAGGFGQATTPPGNGALFYGTSAAAPNVAGVIALLRGFSPTGEPNAAGWKMLAMFNANMGALDSYNLNASGFGLVDASAALAALDPPLTAEIVAPSGAPAQVSLATNVPFMGQCDYTGPNLVTARWTFGAFGVNTPPDATGIKPLGVSYNYGGIYTVTLYCNDGFQSSSDTVKVAVQAPAVAHDYTLSTVQGGSVETLLGAKGVGGEVVSYHIVLKPRHGSVKISLVNGMGRFKYTPDSGFSGSDSFTYVVDNGVEKSNVATVDVNVVPNSVSTTTTLVTSSTTSSSSSSGSGGGGALGGLGLGFLGLIGLALRRKR